MKARRVKVFVLIILAICRLGYSLHLPPNSLPVKCDPPSPAPQPNAKPKTARPPVRQKVHMPQAKRAASRKAPLMPGRAGSPLPAEPGLLAPAAVQRTVRPASLPLKLGDIVFAYIHNMLIINDLGCTFALVPPLTWGCKRLSTTLPIISPRSSKLCALSCATKTSWLAIACDLKISPANAN